MKAAHMPTPSLPVEVQVAILTGLFGIVTSIISAIVVILTTQRTNKHEEETKRHLREQGKAIQSVKEQTNNNHGTNLRDDMDAIRDSIKDLKTGLKTDIGDVRGDISEMKTDINDLRRQTSQVHDGVNNVNRSSMEEHKRIWEHLTDAEKEIRKRGTDDGNDTAIRNYHRNNDLDASPKRRDGRGSGGR